MTDTYSRLAQDDLNLADASPTALVTAGGTEQIIVKHIRVVNQSSSVTAAVKFWQTGTTTDDMILPAADIAGGGWAEFEGTIILNPGEVLYGDSVTPTSGPGTDLTVTIYGLGMMP
jgi:hypothetical protein